MSEQFEAGTRVINEGDAGDKFYLIRQGEVSVLRGSDQEQVAILKEGDFFGEMALLLDQPRNASVVTNDDTVLYSLSQEQFKQAISQQASFESEIRTSLFDRQ